MARFRVLILSAGLGTRMRSDLPKVLHKVAGKPMVCHVVEAASEAGAHATGVVTGYKKELVEKELSGLDVAFIFQEKQLGTGHAVQVSSAFVAEDSSTVVVMPGDVPLADAELLETLVSRHEENNASATVLSMKVEDPSGYGRIIHESGRFTAIREEKDAAEDELEINIVNTGIYAFNPGDLLEAIDRLSSENAQGELYLTDVVEIFASRGKTVAELELGVEDKRARGVNNREQLEELEQVFLKSRRVG